MRESTCDLIARRPESDESIGLGPELDSRVRKRPVQRQSFLSELAVGDYLVHIDHGIGRYGGIRRLSIGGREHDCLEVFYQERDKLFVPVEQLDRLRKYSSAEGETPLNAFDAALMAACIGNTNLVKVSSILPPHCEEISPVRLPFGALVPAAYASASGEQPGEIISAAVAVAEQDRLRQEQDARVQAEEASA